MTPTRGLDPVEDAIARVKRAVVDGPLWLFVPLAILFNLLHPKRGPIRIERAGDLWLVTNTSTGQSYYTPKLRMASLVGTGYGERMEAKYTLEGFVGVEPGDVVVDVGAFVGGFTTAVADRASEVFAFEPAPANEDALARNVAGLYHVTVSAVALDDEAGVKRLELGADPTDHSLVGVDGAETGQSVEVETRRLDEAMRERGIDEVDAEGGEVEVLEGAADIRVRKVAVDCGPERRGEPTWDATVALLDGRGYEVERGGSIVFGRRPPGADA